MYACHEANCKAAACGLLDGNQVTDNRTLLANRDARTEINCF
jgi:hypothetical protein